MRIPRRWLARLTMASVVPIVTGALTMAPASAAGSGCAYPDNFTDVCVVVSGGHVYGYVNTMFDTFITANVDVYQCRPNFTGCGIIASGSGRNVALVKTRTVGAPSGHAFDACASWEYRTGLFYSHICSPWRSWP